MDVIVSGHKNPYYMVWNKRGSKYLTDDEYALLLEEIKPFSLISCEINERVGKTVPFICSENLDIIICTEGEEDYIYQENYPQNPPSDIGGTLPDDPVCNPVKDHNKHINDFDFAHDCNWWDVWGVNQYGKEVDEILIRKNNK